jgi:hypothetical protein
MKTFITTAILLAGIIPARLAAQCPAWESPDKSKKVKVTVWSDEGDCFKLKLDGLAINPDSASQVTFWVDVTASIPKMLVQVHGQEDKKALLMNDGMAALYYKVEKNKKGEYSLKGQPFKAEKTSEAAAKDKADFDARVQKQKDEQAARDKEWNDKRAAEQAERDKKAAEEKEKDKKEEEQRKAERDARYAEQRKQEDDARAKANPPKTETTTTTTTPATTTPATSTTTPAPSGGNGSNSGKTAIRETFLYNGKPIANTVITIKTREGAVIASGKTDDNGKVVMYTDFPRENLQVDFFGEKPGSTWSLKEAMRYNIGSTESTSGTTDFYEVLKLIAEMMGSDAHSMGRLMGFE